MLKSCELFGGAVIPSDPRQASADGECCRVSRRDLCVKTRSCLGQASPESIHSFGRIVQRPNGL